MSADSEEHSLQLDGTPLSVAAGGAPARRPDWAGALGPVADRPAGGGASIFDLLLRHKWLVLVLATLLAGSGIPLIWIFFAPVYRATAVVRISPVIDPVVFRTEKSAMLPFYQSFLNTEVATIKSPTVLDRVLERPEARDTEWFKAAIQGGDGGSSELMEAMKKDVEVLPRPGTELIDISFTTPRPRESKTLADLITNEYRKLKDEQEKASSTQLFETLTSEQVSLQMEIDGLIKTRFNISNRLGTDSPAELRVQLSKAYTDLEADRNKLQRELEMTRWEQRMLAAAQTRPAGAPGPDRRFVSDADWRRLYMAAENAKHEAEVAGQQFGPLNPRMRQLSANVEYAGKVLKLRETQLEEIWKANPGQFNTVQAETKSRESLDYDARRKQQELTLIQAELERQRAKLGEAGDVALEIANYDERIRQKRELYEAVRLRREQLEMEQKAPARVRVASYSTEPVKPFNDRRILLTAVAVIGSLGAGLGVGYLRSAIDKRIYEAGEIQHFAAAPFLGLLPKLPAPQLPQEIGGGGAITVSRRVLMESMRMIRTTLLERVHTTGERVVLVTSSMPETGKTSVAVLLAQSLAMVGKRVLLVEADLRRPVLASRLGVGQSKGLGSLLAENTCDDEVIVHPKCVRFDLVPAGELPPDFDPELMADGNFRACVARWRERYDFVLLDSPPLLRVADAQILAGAVDGTIMVLRSSHDRRNETLQAFAQLSAVGGTLLGTVLIGGQFGRGYPSADDRYGYAYKYTDDGRQVIASGGDSKGATTASS
jgi:polysaccharide biosynthesis transport protein